MDINLKSLIGKLTNTCRQGLEAAVGLCTQRTNHNVEVEHFIFKLGENPNGDVIRIYRQFEINAQRVDEALLKVIEKFKTGNERMPGISPDVLHLAKQAWILSTIDFGFGKIRSGMILLAALTDETTRPIMVRTCREFERIDVPTLRNRFDEIVHGSDESDEATTLTTASSAATGADPTKPGVAVSTKTPNLDQFTIDLTQRAKEGKIDPVLGRDPEIRQIIDILTRRRQNNPILTGEAGVGKTAVVEGFAIRVAEKEVPPPLQNVRVHTLDLGLLQAGAGVKGEFENRLKGVIEEVKKSPIPIIMFIDEAHTMIGAGGQQGQGDAANLLKPALARGELRTIAATTWSEYKKYFEKDAALARRFQVVKVEEPGEENAISMMRGLVDTLEKHHNVTILSEAVEASVRLSARFLSGRQLPDKSVSLLDTACARVAIGQTAIPASIEDTRRNITVTEREIRLLEAEQAAGGHHEERIANLNEKLVGLKDSLAKLEERWNAERELVQQIREIRTKLRDHTFTKAAATAAHATAGAAVPAGQVAGAEVSGAPPAAAPTANGAATNGAVSEKILSDEQVTNFRAKLDELGHQLKELQGENPLMQPVVDAQTVAEVISNWTGIPAGRMVADQIQTVLNLENLLNERIIGQNHALKAITRRVQTSRANMDDPKKPIGVFLFVGSSGVGKTETAVALADLLYGGEKNMVTINMSEFKHEASVSGLIGTTAGFVGYGEGGRLTEAVRRKPYSVVLLDEVEKADKKVHEIFFQVFDKGMLTDGEGREVDFKNTIILLTSNVATDKIVSLCADPETTPEPEQLALAIRPELEQVFPPALLGRLVTVVYYPLRDEVMRQIIKLKLSRIVKRVRENHNVPLTYDAAIVEAVRERCQEASSGARNVDNILTNTLLPDMSNEFLARMAEGKTIEAIHVTLGEDGNFVYNFS